MNTGLVIVWLALAAELPPWLLGVWTRDWMEWKGVRTSVLDVHYLQTPTIFGDVRIPIDRPKFPRATSFADLTDSELRSLTRQLGYAGRTTVTGDTSTWHEEIEFQPDDGSPDMGRLERVNDSTMYEHALDSSYVESWRSVSRGEGRFLVVCVERDARLERTLIVVGNQFLYVRNRAKDLPVAESLDSRIITTRATRAQIIAYLDCEFSTGRVRGRPVPWQIERSTLPWREGRHLDFVDGIAVPAAADSVVPRVASPGRWSVPVNTLTRAELHALFPSRDPSQ